MAAWAAVRRATVEQRQRYGDSFLLALQLAWCKGGLSKGRQGALGAQLAQERPRGDRRSVRRRASSRQPTPTSGRAHETEASVWRASCAHVWSVCACDRAVCVNSARRFAGSAGESAAVI
jgi:hypothetical protein